MNHVIVGTSGHIDHGKTTLIKALTGREMDSLNEEKKRGISIELGFTHFDLPNGNRVGIIDVPGHERFIRNMLAGAAGIDLFLLVIAADEGIMPQTMEHANILSFLNIRDGLIVLTKSDMVEDDFRELVIEDIKDQFKDTFLDGKEIIEVDSVSKKGIDILIDKIQSLSEKIEDKELNAPPRLNVDRVFTLKGHGTVITGTLLDGQLSTDDEVNIYPEGLPARIRNIQVHGTSVDTAYAGQRTAINISNLNKDEISRGDVLAAPHSVETSMMIDVRLSLIKDTDHTITHWDRIRLYHGSREILCRAVPLDTEIIQAGESALVQLRLEEKIVCKKGDDFVIMAYSPMVTIGGGVIIDTSDRKNKAFDKNIIETLKIKEEGETDEIVAEYLKQNPNFYNTLEDIMSYTGESRSSIEDTLMDLINEKTIIDINNSYLHVDYYKSLADRISKLLTNYHKDNPLSIGIVKEELRTQVDSEIKSRDFNLLLELLSDEDLIKIYNNYVSLKNFEIKLDDAQEKIKESIISKLKKLDYTDIPNISDLAGGDREKMDLIYYLINVEEIAKFLGDESVLHMDHYNDAKNILLDYFQDNDEVTLAQFRDLIDSSRRNCLLLLEEFDRERLTIRDGNSRKLLKRK